MEEHCSQKLLTDFLHDELRAEEQQYVEEHLENCSICRKQTERLSSNSDLSELKESSLHCDQSSQNIILPVALVRRLYGLHIPSEASLSKQEAPPEHVFDPTGSLPDELPESIGEYDLRRTIGRGGMGIVVDAFHRKLKRHVAIKLMNTDRVRGRSAIRRFYREMRALGNLDHQNIVRAIDAGEIEALPYLVMEYVDGPNLERIVRLTGPLSVFEACEIVHQAACGLQHAHELGMIHRDIKPSNLLINRNGQVKVVDLGLAQFNEMRLQDSGKIQQSHFMGTIDFMSPEQAENPGQTDKRSDIYSLGCTFYYLLTGKPVYEGGSIAERIRAHREQALPSLSIVLPDSPEELDAILQRLLAKNPDDRFQSMEEVDSALETILDKQDPLTLPASEDDPQSNSEIAFDASAVISLLREKVRRVFDETVDVQATETDAVFTPMESGFALPSQRRRKLFLSGVITGCMVCGFLIYSFVSQNFLYSVFFETATAVPEDNPYIIQTLQVKRRVRVSSIGFFRDGRRIYCGTDNSVQIWDLPSPKLIIELDEHPKKINSVALSLDNSLILTGCADGKIRLFDVETGTEVRTFEGHEASVNSAIFLNDDHKILSCAWDGTVRLWDTETATQLKTCMGWLGIYAIAVSGDESRVLFGGKNQTVVLWDLKNWKKVAEMPHNESVMSVAFSPDDRFAVSASWDNTARVWDLASGDEILTIACHSNVNTAVFSFDGEKILVGSDDEVIRVWDLNGRRQVADYRDVNIVDCIAFSPDGKTFLTSTGRFSGIADSTIRFWNIPEL